MKQVKKVVIYDEGRTRNNVVRFLEKTKCAATTSRVNDGSRRDIIRAVGMEGFVLFHYYVGKQNVPNFLFTDGLAARALCTTARKIAGIRRKLIRCGWFLQYNEYYDKHACEYVIRTVLGYENIRTHVKNADAAREENLNSVFGSDINTSEDVL